MTVEITTNKSIAQGGHCATCNQFFNITTCPYWHWGKSVAMHRSGAGHKVELYVISTPDSPEMAA